jgi:predicted O-methyltransferase YrrM
MNPKAARAAFTPTLSSPTVRAVLDRLYRHADAVDDAALARTNPITDAMYGDEKFRVRSEMLSEAYLPVPQEVGRLLYMLARTYPCKTIVEFGTSLAISTIHLASAVRDNGGGKVIATELHPGKACRAGENLREAGLLDLVEIRVGDARETLRSFDGPVDFAFLDGWKELYLPVLQLIEPHLRKGALIVADNMNIGPPILKPFLDYIGAEANGYVSLELPIGDRLALSLRLAPDP